MKMGPKDSLAVYPIQTSLHYILHDTVEAPSAVSYPGQGVFFIIGSAHGRASPKRFSVNLQQYYDKSKWGVHYDPYTMYGVRILFHGV